MILLVAGTIAQKNVGLYVAQHTYFSSFVIWFFGIVPFPGGYTLLGVFFANLLAKFLLFSEWQWRKCGIILSHFGILLLIAGGALTAITEREGYLVAPQGKLINFTEDYHQRELRILKNNSPVLIIPHEALRSGQIISDPALPWPIQLDLYCYSCSISRRPETQQEKWTEPGKFMQLLTAELETDDEQNLTGIEFTIDDRRYVTFDKFPKPPVIEAGKDDYTIMIGRSQHVLPFTVRLDRFSRELHPGSEMAKAYTSEITLIDGDESWPAEISMNQPLRYKGYTLYQSSYDENGDTPLTVLSVVQNRGRIFPYVSSLILAFGLLLHLVIRLRERRQKS